MDVLDLRLPRAVRAAARAGRRRVRHREGRRDHARRVHTVHTDRGDLRAPLVVDALGWRRVLADDGERRSSRPRRGCRAAWRSTPRLTTATTPPDLELWLDRAYVRAGYAWSFPAGDELRVGVGSFDPRRPRQGADRAPGRGARRAGRALPGQLDPPPHAPGRRGRRVLRRRQRRALPADDGRGHPHGAVLRDRLRARAARGARRPPDARAGAGPLRRVLRRPRAGLRLAVARAVAGQSREPLTARDDRRPARG